MAHCTQCGSETTAQMRFCPSCGTQLVGDGPARAALHLEDLTYGCENCGTEHSFGELSKCRACHDRVCRECVGSCSRCREATCVKCQVECDQCKKRGCLRCFQVCETCRGHAMCPEHIDYCDDCQYPTCDKCFTVCRNCDLDICTHCRDEAHDPKRRGKHLT